MLRQNTAISLSFLLIFFYSRDLLVSGIMVRDTSFAEAEGNITTTRECVLMLKDEVDCSGIKYPTIDGKCNNPLNAYAGAAGTPFKRLIPPSFNDGFQSFRTSSSGHPLPQARYISNVVNPQDEQNPRTTVVNAMFVQFGQYLTHDLTSTPVIEADCNCVGPDPTCKNIPVPYNDAFYELRATCIPLMGTQTVEGCPDFPAEQINTLTAYIDAGTIYGNSKELLNALRDNDSDYGALRLVPMENHGADNAPSPGCPVHRNNKLLQDRSDVEPAIAKMFACAAHFNSPACFVSGEEGTNENIGLSSSHMIFTREHNRIAKRLKTINSHWGTDKVFQETRRIMIAVHQKITYGEFLPLLLGSKLMQQFDLHIVNNGFYYGHDATYDATISNSFATTAFRYGHSQVGSFYHRPGPDYATEQHPSIRVFRGLFQQGAVLNGTSPSIMRGLMIDPAQATDVKFVEDLRNRMMESETNIGRDLLAINIQRGREHGIPPYNQFREFCGYQRATEWTDLYDVMSEAIVERLRGIYESVDDVDLTLGGLAENPVSHGNVGPTFGCIIGYQFRDIRKGDRFWFENPGQFSEAQLRELQKVSLSKILCDNLHGMETVPPNAMLLEEELNSRVPCSGMPTMNIDSWKDFNPHQDGVWTRWFAAEPMLQENILQKIMNKNPDSLCKNPLRSEKEPIAEGRTDVIKVRYLCPAGSITSSSFPNTKENLNYYWTPWFDRDSPSSSDGSDDESLQHLRIERAGEVCDGPLYMQAQTKERDSAFDSDEVFYVLSPKYGLICRGSDQPRGRCKDYRVRFYCPKNFRAQMVRKMHDLVGRRRSSFPSNVWTEWINLGSPWNGHSSYYDLETLSFARSRHYNVCRRPLLIEGRVVGTNTHATRTGDVLKRYSIYHGLICDNRDQLSGMCHDYEVRYLCPAPTLHGISR